MMPPQTYAEFDAWWAPVALAGGGLVLGLLVRRFVLPLAAKWASKSAWKYDDILVDAMRNPIVVLFMLIGIRLALKVLPLASEVDQTLGSVALVLGIFAVTWAVARFAAGAVRVGTGAGGYQAVSLLANVARAVVFAVGILMMLQALNIKITGIIAALGVGGLAVGLALQDTLANFFAGIRILMAGKVRPGHYIQLENAAQEGFVEDITWGQTTIRQGAGNLIIVPNSKLSTAIVTNYALPMAPQVFVVNVGVAYGTDLTRAEHVALEVAKDVLKSVPEGVPDFNPTVRFTGFGDSSVNFFVVLQTKAYPDRWAVISEFVKRLHKRYGDEGIEIPFPQRVVHLHQPAETPPSASRGG